MMKLWLDDLRPAPFGWTHARSVNQAIWKVMLSSSLFERASLDHDLGEFSDDGGDGWYFVLWMIESGIWPVIKPTVHSMNPVGRQRMVEDIERYWNATG